MPSHGEIGFWRMAGGHVELVIAHPNGMASIEDGPLDGQRVELSTTAVARTTTAKAFAGLTRIVSVEGDVLTYQLAMAVVDQPLAPHLEARLVRV